MPSFVRASYLGGSPSLGSAIRDTHLHFDGAGIHVGVFGSKRAVSWDEMTSVDIADGQTAKAPGAILSGARGMTSRATITVTTKTGEQLYQIDRVSAAEVRGQVLSLLAKHGLDKTAKPAATVGSVADELAKLAALRDSGVLTAAEFEKQKARLLDA